MQRKKCKGKTPKIRPQRRVSGWTPAWTAMTVLIVVYAIAAVVHVRAQLAVVQLGYQLSKAAQVNEKLTAETRKLQLEVATLRDPRRLRRLAKQELGLAEPKPAQILRSMPGEHDPERLAAGSSADKEPLN